MTTMEADGSVRSAGSSKAGSRASRASSHRSSGTHGSKKSKSGKKPAPKVDGIKMEVWAVDFKDMLQNKLTTNKVGTLVHTTIPNSFRGDEAMEALMTVLTKYHEDETGGGEISTDFAIQVGRAFMDTYGLFVNATTPAKTFDGPNKKDIYIFQNNIPIQVHKARKMYFSDLATRVALLERELEVKDRNKGKHLKRCFLAQDAIDCIMKNKLAISRTEAVQYLNNMNKRANFCKSSEPNKPTEFKDKKDRFLVFTLPEERTIPAVTEQPEKTTGGNVDI